MFKSTRKRQSNKLTFEEELNQQLQQLKQQTPQKSTYIQKNKEIVTIIDEVVNQLKTPIQITPKKQSNHKKYNEIRQIDSLKLDQNSSISLNSKEGLDEESQQNEKNNKVIKDHISNLVNHSQISNILIDNFKDYTQNDNIQLYDFFKKIYSYYFDIRLKQQEIFMLKSKLKNELTTTDPEYLSLNALQIVAKRHEIKKYLQSSYINVKIDQKIGQYQKKNKKIIQQLKDIQDLLKQRQLRLSLQQSQYEKKLNAVINRQKVILSKQKQFTLKEKELKKSIQQKCQKLYQTYLSQFSQKIKQTQKRLNNTEKNIKYKVQILERRSQGLKILINQKNDLKNKKIMNENDAKIKLRRIQKQMDQLEKKHQSQLQIYEKEQKQLIKSISILQQKLSKNERKSIKQKQRILQLEQQLTITCQKFEKMVQKCSDLQHKLQKIEKQPLKSQQVQIKISKQKTSRSNKPKKRNKNSQLMPILSLYQIVLQSINSFGNIQHFQYQQLIQRIMKITVKQLPQLIYLLTAFEDEQDSYKQPHYLIINIANIIINQFYFLNKQHQASVLSNSKLKSTDLQELLKYPYAQQISRSFFFLFLQIYDWDQAVSSIFFTKVLQGVIQQIESNNILSKNELKNNQINLFTSSQCSFFFIIKFFPQIIRCLQVLEKNPKNLFNIGIAIVDLFLILIKQEVCVFEKLTEDNIQNILTQTLLKTLEGIWSVYGNGSNKNKGKINNNKLLFECIDQMQEFSQKMSIFMQRFYYKFQHKIQQIPHIKHLRNISDRLYELSRSNGNRHSLILANLKSIFDMPVNIQ